MHNIKKVFKFIIILLVIGAIGFVAYRYKELKEQGKLDELFASSKNENYIDNPLGTEVQGSSSSSTNSSETDEKKDTEKTDDREYIVEDKNYDGYYNKFNFDNVLLLYEGNQDAQATKEALNVLIKDADDTMYSKPTVKFENFSGLSSNEISAENLDEYKSVLNQAKNSLGNLRYEISFENEKITQVVNKIIITRK